MEAEIERVKKLIAGKEELVRHLAGKGQVSENIAVCQQIAGLKEYLRCGSPELSSLDEQARTEARRAAKFISRNRFQ